MLRSLFKQATTEVYDSLLPVFSKKPHYKDYFKIITVPERTVSFRVLWDDDKGKQHVNNGYRVQFNSALGPYKGGLRFHPSVDLDTIKFLGFEQIFKNSLTGLAMGGGKGGSDFDPKGKSDAEIRRFCKAFMSNLYREIGPDTDIPAGDIGVGGREIGYLYGEYKRLTRTHVGVLTGKDQLFGGSKLRPEATGFGTVYYLQSMLKYKNDTMKNKNVIITGSGNVAQYAVEKSLELGAKVKSVSDSRGSLIFSDSINHTELMSIQDLKLRGLSLENHETSGTFYKDSKPWDIITEPVDIVLPCATQNEVILQDANKIVSLGAKYVAEGSNMGTDHEGVEYFSKNGVFYAPGKASNLGGVGVSGLEMSQNSQRMKWTNQEVDEKLKNMMDNCFNICVKTAEEYESPDNLVVGSNIASFLIVTEAMEKQGILYSQ
jgi:glutamate dehydrogenase (NADP+)